MMQPEIADATDFCRRCRGRGSQDEDNGHGQQVSFSCPDCGGTGKRAMLVGKADAISETCDSGDGTTLIALVEWNWIEINVNSLEHDLIAEMQITPDQAERLGAWLIAAAAKARD